MRGPQRLEHGHRALPQTLRSREGLISHGLPTLFSHFSRTHFSHPALRLYVLRSRKRKSKHSYGELHVRVWLTAGGKADSSSAVPGQCNLVLAPGKRGGGTATVHTFNIHMFFICICLVAMLRNRLPLDNPHPPVAVGLVVGTSEPPAASRGLPGGESPSLAVPSGSVSVGGAKVLPSITHSATGTL